MQLIVRRQGLQHPNRGVGADQAQHVEGRHQPWLVGSGEMRGQDVGRQLRQVQGAELARQGGDVGGPGRL